MKVKEVFEKLIERGYEPKYFFYGKNLIIDPDEPEPVEGFKAVGYLGLVTVSDPPFDSGNVEEWIFHEIADDIESNLRKDGIDPNAEVDGYFVYYDTEWKAWYPLILVRNWKLLEKTQGKSNEPHLWISVGWKYHDAGEISKAKIGRFFVSTVYPEENAVEISLYWLLHGLADEFPDAVKEKHPLIYEVNLSALRDALPARHPWLDE